MKKGNLDKWKNINECQNLLLFSQLVNELLFDYSIPSNRVPTLNSHYLCFDALNAITTIDVHGVPEGTLKPIMEEFYLALQKDPVFEKVYIKPTDYFLKYQGEKYNISKPSEMGYKDLKKCAMAIHSRFFQDNQYYNDIKDMIIEIIVKNEIADQKDLYRLVKSLLTELMNAGYTLRYIFELMKRLFWNSRTCIDSANVINDFFEAFSFENKEYEVVCIVNKAKIKDFLSVVDDVDYVNNIDARTGTHQEKQFLKILNREAFLIQRIKALDPFAAAENYKSIMSDNFALYRLYDHGFRFDISTAKIGVYSENTFYRVTKTVEPIEHTKKLSRTQLMEGMNQYERVLNSVANRRSPGDFISILNAAKFHSNSLESNSRENQLLDLWAIFESVLNVSSSHTSDRISQVCMYIVPIVKRGYIYSLFEQLASDIKNYDNDLFQSIVEDDDDLNGIISKVCKFVILDNDKRERLISSINDFPLLKERIQYYNQELSETKKVYDFVEKHAERVKWQVMRIYRNRNLIIHNADSMPYLGLLIENLHSYVDVFLEYSINNLAEGHNIESMCQNLFVKECEWHTLFRKKNRVLDESLIRFMLSV
ncbi:MAG: hypothetical protein E7241_00185 [Lachnospiraceae bacterium]|nr:hypothetical protein [Lachnospiraceae bacterium]